MQTMLLIKDLRHNFEAVGRMQAEYFGKHRPTCTTFEVGNLVLPQQLVEISAIAVIPNQKG